MLSYGPRKPKRIPSPGLPKSPFARRRVRVCARWQRPPPSCNSEHTPCAGGTSPASPVRFACRASDVPAHARRGCQDQTREHRRHLSDRFFETLLLVRPSHAYRYMIGEATGRAGPAQTPHDNICSECGIITRPPVLRWASFNATERCRDNDVVNSGGLVNVVMKLVQTADNADVPATRAYAGQLRWHR
jgi:hypothetical protein